MDLPKIKDYIHEKLLRLRALDRLVTSRRFEAALKLDPDSEELRIAFSRESPSLVENWMNKVLIKELDDMSVRELRVRAARLHITFYTTYDKSALILKILEVQENARKAEQAALDVPLPQADADLEGLGKHERDLPCGAGCGGTGDCLPQDGPG